MSCPLEESRTEHRLVHHLEEDALPVQDHAAPRNWNSSMYKAYLQYRKV